MKKTITQQKFIDELMEQVNDLYNMREKTKGTKYEQIAFGNQIGLLYVIDYLQHVYTIKN